MLVLLTSRSECRSHLLLFGLSLLELLQRFGEGRVGGDQAGLEHRKFLVGLPQLLIEGSHLHRLFLFFFGRFDQAIVVEFDGHLEGLNGLTEF